MLLSLAVTLKLKTADAEREKITTSEERLRAIKKAIVDRVVFRSSTKPKSVDDSKQLLQTFQVSIGRSAFLGLDSFVCMHVPT